MRITDKKDLARCFAPELPTIATTPDAATAAAKAGRRSARARRSRCGFPPLRSPRSSGNRRSRRPPSPFRRSPRPGCRRARQSARRPPRGDRRQATAPSGASAAGACAAPKLVRLFLDEFRHAAQFAGEFRRGGGQGADLFGLVVEKSHRVVHAESTAVATLPVPNFLEIGFFGLGVAVGNPHAELCFCRLRFG